VAFEVAAYEQGAQVTVLDSQGSQIGHKESIADTMRMLSMILGLVVAILGLANVMPTFDVLPRIGPFDLSWFRPMLYWLCMLSVLAMSLSQHVTRFKVVLAATACVMLTIASWDNYQIGLLLEDSVFFFGEREFWISSLVVASAIYIAFHLLFLHGYVSIKYISCIIRTLRPVEPSAPPLESIIPTATSLYVITPATIPVATVPMDRDTNTHNDDPAGIAVATPVTSAHATAATTTTIVNVVPSGSLGR